MRNIARLFRPLRAMVFLASKDAAPRVFGVSRAARKPSSPAFLMGLAILLFAATACTESDSGLAPIHNDGAKSAIPNQYIIIFKPDTADELIKAAQNTVEQLGGKVKHVYRLAPIGFSAEISREAVQSLRRAPGSPI